MRFPPHRRALLLASLVAATPAAVGFVPLDKPKYHVTTEQGPDRETGGWFINLGITGARAKILEERPREFEVAYVFPNTPAAGILAVGDRIVGIEGARFEVPHKFGYGVKFFGYEGPMMDFAAALDRAQGADGQLELEVLRSERPLRVTLTVPTSYGAYGTTYPYDCAKTDRILDETLEWLAERQRDDGTWHGRPHLNAFAALALLAGDDDGRFAKHTARAARACARMTNDVIGYEGLDCWKYGLYGIYLAEYFLATHEAWVLDELREIDRWLRQAQMANGGWGHRPADRPGGNGYGAICVITMQAKLAWSLMARCGIEIDRVKYEAAHDFVVKGTNDFGYVWYKDGNGGNDKYADMGRTGAAALAHATSPFPIDGYVEYARRAARCIGDNPTTFPDTHGSPILGMVWTALGAAADPGAFRNLMDYNRWSFTLAHCADGTFYYQPNRDNNPQDYTAAPRLSATAATALILTLRDGRLAMMKSMQAPKPEVSANWPSFRGTEALGLGSGRTPTTWNVEDGTNVRWRVPVAGLAHSSPVVWGDRVFVTTAVRAGGEAELSSLYGSPGYGAGDSVEDEGVHAFRVLCFDKVTGETLWQRDARVAVPKVKRHPKSTHANPTPVCDAKRVITFFGSEGLYCFDHDGTMLWWRDLGVLNSGAPGYRDTSGFQWGFASSPILHGDRVVVQCDVEDQSFLAVLDADTGEDVWRVERDEDSTWSTPAVCATGAGGRAQVIVNGYRQFGGYDLETGEVIWTLASGGDVPVPTPIIAHDLVYLTNAHGRLRPIYAVHVDASGAVGMKIDPDTNPHLAWCHPRQGVYMQTPIVIGDLLYCCADGGILSCYDAKTGERMYRERLGGGQTGFSGSAVSTGDTIYYSGENGEIHVVRTGREFELIAVNDMGETCMATPAVSNGVLFVRSRHHLTAIGSE